MANRINERDIIGQQFGELTVIDTAGRAKGGEWIYRCKCSCGKETEVRRACLKNGVTRSCGHLVRRDPTELLGKQFGELTVLELTEQKYHGEKLFRCKCSCGKECFYVGSALRKGERISCGHIRKEDPMKLIGQQFGELTVLELIGKEHGSWLYRCQCSCGKETTASRSDLKSGNKKSCGHLKLIDPQDIVGQKFGELIVDEVVGRGDDGEWRYRCSCSCGESCVVRRGRLIGGSTKSCGHLLRTDFNPETYVGRQFGEWTVLSFSHREGSHWYFNCRCSCGNERTIPKSSLDRGLSKSCGKCAEPYIEKLDNYCRYVFSNGRFFLFDYEDLPLVESRRWTMSFDGYPTDSTQTKYRLSRLILDLNDNEYADHINMDPTDNRRANLRVCTWSENNCNKVLQSNNTSGYKGVTFHRASGKYVAALWKDNVHHYGGLHATKEAAALAYDELARSIHGEFARINFPCEGERGCREAV